MEKFVGSNIYSSEKLSFVLSPHPIFVHELNWNGSPFQPDTNIHFPVGIPFAKTTTRLQRKLKKLHPRVHPALNKKHGPDAVAPSSCLQALLLQSAVHGWRRHVQVKG